MSDQFYKPKPISSSPRKEIFKNQKMIILAVIFIVICLLGWLIIKRFSSDPLDNLEKLIKNKNMRKAAELNYKLMSKYPEHRLAYLMNGSIINFGLRELNITDTHFPFYEYEDFLNKEDRTGVFIRQSFLRKFALFPDSSYFLSEFCTFMKGYPESLKNPETMMTVQHALRSQTRWINVSHECMAELFSHTENFGSEYGTVAGDNLSLREKPETKSRILGKLKKKEIVLVKLEGMEDAIGNKKGKWLFILTRDSLYGWVFGAYIDR